MSQEKQSVEFLSDNVLVSRTQELVREERKLTLEILHLFREIEVRRLFAVLGFSSLFEMATKDFGYSEGSATRRIAAARLLADQPQIEKKIEDGSLSVAALCSLQYFFNDQKKKDKPLSREEKRAVIDKVEGKSRSQTEKILADISGEPVRKDKTRAVSEAQTEVRFTADKKLMQNLEKIRSLKGRKDLHDYQSLLLYMSEVVLDEIDPNRKIARQRSVQCARAMVIKPKRAQELGTPGVKTKQSRACTTNNAGVAGMQQSTVPWVQDSDGSFIGNGQHDTVFIGFPNQTKIPQRVKNAVWKRDGGVCTYRDTVTGRKCESNYALEYDHVHTRALGGLNTAENIRLYCRQHNRLHAIKTYGKKKMEQYLGT